MAITIHTQPQELSPAYNQMIIAVTSSNQTQENFQFVGDVYVNGDLVTRMKVPVNPDGYGVFDIHRHVENGVDFNFAPTNNGWYPATQSFCTYSVEFSEEFRFEWPFIDNAFSAGSLAFVSQVEPLFEIGDVVFVSQTEPYTNTSYNGICEIVSITQSGLTYTVVTNKTFGSSSPVEGGTMSLANYALNIIPTGGSTGEQYAFNGVYSFQDFINYDHTEYIPELVTLGAQIDINSYTDNGGYVRYNCNSAHGLSLGETFEVFQSTYNGIYTVIEVNSTTQVTGDTVWAGAGVLGAEYLKSRSGYGIAKWLTNAPDEYEVGLSSSMWIQAYKDDNNQQKDLYIQTNLGTYRITSAFSANVDTNPFERLCQVGVGPHQLLTYTSSIITGTSSFPVMDSTTATYSIWAQNQILQQDTEVKVFKIKDWCSRYEQIQLIFMDKLGSFIPYTFNKVNRENRSISRTNYQQRYGSYAPASQNWGYNTYDRGKKSLDTVVTETYTVNSDWVNQSTSDFLMELFESPIVYWINEDGLTQAVNITSNSTERKQTINDQIINYTLTFELSNKNMSQRG